MADRRMFARTIVMSDPFLDMPLGARCLYFAAGMLADDDGFVNGIKSIMRQVGAREEDIRILVEKKFLILFESGLVLIKHWKINNYIQKDRYHQTKYRAEMDLVEVKENGAYRMRNGVYTEYQDTEIRLGKDSIDNASTKTNVVPTYQHSTKKDTTAISSSRSAEGVYTESEYTWDFEETMKIILQAWNETGGKKARYFKSDSRRADNLRRRIADNGMDTVLETIEKVKDIPFFLGENKRRWVITLDWFLDPDNFQKILEGQFDERFVSDDDLGGAEGAGGTKTGGGRSGAGDTEADVRARRQEEARRRFPNLKTGLD